ncbi:MAG TPA: pilus assembly protein N-terminal domain-containing protein, partial [Candidatus Omnitrophota bacterium]|nr:pilus assembly protein N-terminal domain-containing protein [Candidatus Omnitrophota bacterium]
MKKQQQQKIQLVLSLSFFLILFLSFLSRTEIYGDDTAAATAQTTPVSTPAEDIKDNKVVEANVWGEIEMLRGDLETLEVHSLTRVSVSNPEVADFSSVESDRVVVLAKKAGQTEVFLWDENGKKTILIRVLDEDLLSLKSRLEALLKIMHIEGVSFVANAYEGKLIALGDLPKDKKEQFAKMI